MEIRALAPDIILDGWKLFRLRSDGSFGPLFLDTGDVLPYNEWVEAKDNTSLARRKGLKPRPGWHATLSPVAPHLKLELSNGERRIWVPVLLRGVTLYDRPESQGGTWVLAREIRIVR
jgi:hypothetical protein